MDSATEIDTRIQELTPEYRGFLTGGTPELLVEIFAEANGLDDTQWRVLENGTMLFLLLFLTRDEYVAFVRDECSVDEVLAKAIVSGIIEALPVSVSYELNRMMAAPANSIEASIPPQSEPQTTMQSVVIDTEPIATTTLDHIPPAQPRTSASLASMSAIPEPPQITPLAPVGQSDSVQHPPVETVPISAPNATAVEPVRTMEGDIDRVHGYGAFREKYPHLYTDEEMSKATIRSVAQDALLRRAPVVETPNFTSQPPTP
jgi:hypothetical protein